jgi:hypothetical protein
MSANNLGFGGEKPKEQKDNKSNIIILLAILLVAS